MPFLSLFLSLVFHSIKNFPLISRIFSSKLSRPHLVESSTRFEKRGHEQETEKQKERARLTLTRSILDAIW